MKDEQIAKANPHVYHFPTVMGAVVLAYNLPGVTGELKLTPEILADFFLGKLFYWNDPKIAAVNPGLKLPDVPVMIVHRSDGSGTTAVFVTHGQEGALLLGDHVGVMCDGQLEQIGTPEDIFHRPQTRFVAEFLGQTRFMPGRVADDGVSSVLGHLPARASAPVGSEVEIALRPDDVTFVADETSDGRIISRRFTGISYLYQIGSVSYTHLTLPTSDLV